MEAVIIVKVHDDLDLDKVKADVLIHSDGKRIYRSHMKLRPLPQRKLEWNWGPGARDWNACLDEILGETE